MDDYFSSVKSFLGQLRNLLRGSLTQLPELNAGGRRRYLKRLVENGRSQLHHFQVLLVFVASAFDVRHPAALLLLTGVHEETHVAVTVKHLKKIMFELKKVIRSKRRPILGLLPDSGKAC